MDKKPRNKWIAYGVRFFAYSLLLFLISLVFVDVSFVSLPPWAQIILRILPILYLSLPIASFLLCVYGLFTLDKAKESGYWDAIAVIVILGVFGVYIGSLLL